jgi:3-hydroxyisobutyrate dehydrogenase-like beta-hydroxyacid dehydrogenase
MIGLTYGQHVDAYKPQYGFVGLGDMGGPMAANIAASGHSLKVYDAAGSLERAPARAVPCHDITAVAQQCDTVFLSLPDGRASNDVVNAIAETEGRRTQVVIDLSTTGVAEARKLAQYAQRVDIEYIDCPVSGGRAGAIAGTITLIFAGSNAVLDEHRDVLSSFSGNLFHVGEHAGQGQAMKLLNNFLSAVAMAATSEAITYGLKENLDMKTMLDVLNVSTGQNTATKDKFVNRILTGSYDAGFRTRLMRKDVGLYRQAVVGAQTPHRIADTLDQIWEEVEKARPDGDFTEIFKYICAPAS